MLVQIRSPNASKVICTGDFDGWSKCMEMEKKDGIWTCEVPDDSTFKFVVDDTWICSDSYAKVFDQDGNENNVVYGKSSENGKMQDQKKANLFAEDKINSQSSSSFKPKVLKKVSESNTLAINN